jgi:hypothetical protein
MPLRPTEGNEKCFQSSNCSACEAPPSPLSSRAQSRDLQFNISLPTNLSSRPERSEVEGPAVLSTFAQPGKAIGSTGLWPVFATHPPLKSKLVNQIE